MQVLRRVGGEGLQPRALQHVRLGPPGRSLFCYVPGSAGEGDFELTLVQGKLLRFAAFIQTFRSDRTRALHVSVRT